MARHLSDEDLDILAIYLDRTVLHEIRKIKESTMAIEQTLAQLATEVPEIKTDVETLITLANAAASGTATPEQLAELQSFADALAAVHTEAQAAINPTAPTAPANTDAATGFVWKLPTDTSFEDAKVRLVDYNAANPDNQVADTNFITEDQWNLIVL